jgi:CheY-like chemotaxis protein
MLTAREAVEARLAGLDSGADDCLTKPFDFGELPARLRAIIRRGRRPQTPPVLCADPPVISRSSAAKDQRPVATNQRVLSRLDASRMIRTFWNQALRILSLAALVAIASGCATTGAPDRRGLDDAIRRRVATGIRVEGSAPMPPDVSVTDGLTSQEAVAASGPLSPGLAQPETAPPCTGPPPPTREHRPIS